MTVWQIDKRGEPRPFRTHAFTIVGLLAVYRGLSMLLFDKARFSSGAYRWAFEWAPLRVWGGVFLGSGLLVLGKRTWWTVGILIVVLTTWALQLVAATVTGDSGSPLLPDFQIATTVLVASAAWRFGTGERPQGGRRGKS